MLAATGVWVGIPLYGVGGSIILLLLLISAFVNATSSHTRAAPQPPRPRYIYFAESHPGAVCALLVDPATGHFVVNPNTGRYIAVGSLDGLPNAPTRNIEVTHDYLMTHCHVVSEAQARVIHPALFG